jgi:hypothetical protein
MHTISCCNLFRDCHHYDPCRLNVMQQGAQERFLHFCSCCVIKSASRMHFPCSSKDVQIFFCSARILQDSISSSGSDLHLDAAEASLTSLACSCSGSFLVLSCPFPVASAFCWLVVAAQQPALSVWPLHLCRQTEVMPAQTAAGDG